MQHPVYKYKTRIREDGTLKLNHLPFKKGTHVEVILMERKEDDFSDLLRASTAWWLGAHEKDLNATKPLTREPVCCIL